VGERVDHEGAVIQQHGAPEESNDESDPTHPEKTHDREKSGRGVLVAIEPAQLRVLREIRNCAQVSHVMARSEDPAHVRIPEALVTRRMDVQLSVRMAVMMPVLGGPPKNATLGRRLREEAENELKNAARLE